MIQLDEDFLSLYLNYTSETECPTFFHRWAGITALGAWLGRNVSFNFGHFVLHPTMYTLFVGDPGTRKTTGIKIAAKLLEQAGYKHFAPQKIRQEKFLADLAEANIQPLADGTEDILEQNLFGDLDVKEPRESFIAADEFGNFIGAGNLDFMSILGELWDYEGVYKYKLRNNDDVFIPNPTVSILGGITAIEFNRVFPQEAIGQGFFSRLLIIHDKPSGKRYTLPPIPDSVLRDKLIKHLQRIRNEITGEITITEAGFTLLDRVYHSWGGIPDNRFDHYSNRRQTHLLKLCMIAAASRLSNEIDKEDVIRANTFLTGAEYLMPQALGEFGKGRLSDVTHKVLKFIMEHDLPVSFQEIWKYVHMDLEKRDQLVEIIQNLLYADKLQAVDNAYLPKRMVRTEADKEAINWNLLTDSEKQLINATGDQI
jgi:hypothetical protein